MSILDNLKKVKEDVTRRPHPCSGEPETFKSLYVVGVAMMALTTDNDIDALESESLRNLLLSMNLGESHLPEIIAKAKEGAENIIQALVQSLQTPDQKDAFAFDLLAIMRVGKAPDADGREKLNLFLDLMKFSTAQRTFIASFSAAAVTKSTPQADKALVEAYENGLQPDLKIFGYFFPELVAVGSGYHVPGLRDFGAMATSEVVENQNPHQLASQPSTQTSPSLNVRPSDSPGRWLGPSAADDGNPKSRP